MKKKVKGAASKKKAPLPPKKKPAKQKVKPATRAWSSKSMMPDPLAYVQRLSKSPELRTPSETDIKLITRVVQATSAPLDVVARAIGIDYGLLMLWLRKGQDPTYAGTVFDQFFRAMDMIAAQDEVLHAQAVHVGARGWARHAWMLERKYWKRWGQKVVSKLEALYEEGQEEPGNSRVPEDAEYLAKVCAALDSAGMLQPIVVETTAKEKVNGHG